MVHGVDALRRLWMGAGGLTGLDRLAVPVLGGVGAILMLHRVTDRLRHPEGPNRHLAVSPSFLDRVLAAARKEGLDLVSMDEAVARLDAGGGGARFLAITADDGYRDNHSEALPVLERHEAPITVYIAPGLNDRRDPLWWDVIEDAVASGRTIDAGTHRLALDCSTPRSRQVAFERLLRLLGSETPEHARNALVEEIASEAGVDAFRPSRETLMDWDELARFAAHPLVTIGAHTVHHPNLRRLEESEARREMEESRDRLAEALGHPPRHFAFPYGSRAAAGPREAKLAGEAGFLSAVTTNHGVLMAGHRAHRHALPRISLNGRFQHLPHVTTMLRGFTTPAANKGRRLVTF
ncbi:MAG: polysaccharide deacetylase [Mesorhizobium amorphae]|nr:MAG: polysaccharide deacetylase [Mesorhizobium amorphae]